MRERCPNHSKKATMQDETIAREMTIVLNVSSIQVCVKL